MRLDKQKRIVITRRQAAEIFFLLSNARHKLQGKLRTSADKYWAEFEDVLELNPNKDYK